MRVLNIGATGKVGRLTTRRAKEAGHEITAFGRSAGGLAKETEVYPFAGDVTDQTLVDEAMRGQDAVVLTFGAPLTMGTITHEPDLCEVGTRNVVNAMKGYGVDRLICMTMIGVGDSKGHGRLVYRDAIRPIMLGRIAEDRERQEEVVRAGGLDWTIVRPTELNDDEDEAENVRAFEDLDGVTAKTIPRPSVARFLVDKLRDDDSIGRTFLITE